MGMKTLAEDAVLLLQKLITIESYSGSENKTADALETFLKNNGVNTNRYLNNVWALNKHFDPQLPTILLNSHHDTVKANSRYTRDPFEPALENGKLFGLGSNDAGGALVSLLACFLHFYNNQDLKFNLLFAGTAEEEISGRNGIEALLEHLGPIAFGIVGEPTNMDIAIAEKGLMVLDCVAHGVAGHAAHGEGENAIYKAVKDIEWFRTFEFPEVSETLGTVKMTVSIIKAGLQHNIVPDACAFTVDVRTTDKYSNLEVLDVITQHLSCEIKPRSVRLNSSSVSKDHPMVKAGASLGARLYGSPTTSDQALLNFPTFKMGPGDSKSSHTADEFIYVDEIGQGIALYIKLLNTFNSTL